MSKKRNYNDKRQKINEKPSSEQTDMCKTKRKRCDPAVCVQDQMIDCKFIYIYILFV